jgi:hypothetical protein
MIQWSWLGQYFRETTYDALIVHEFYIYIERPCPLTARHAIHRTVGDFKYIGE